MWLEDIDITSVVVANFKHKVGSVHAAHNTPCLWSTLPAQQPACPCSIHKMFKGSHKDSD